MPARFRLRVWLSVVVCLFALIGIGIELSKRRQVSQNSSLDRDQTSAGPAVRVSAAVGEHAVQFTNPPLIGRNTETGYVRFDRVRVPTRPIAQLPSLQAEPPNPALSRPAMNNPRGVNGDRPMRD